mmetsp:Transcript_79897/g.185509  ORF Transcript_79897/g.185509 Transcript_79897/m.185509 type:complete len:281 (-) Transcript_79897:31-873(-)
MAHATLSVLVRCQLWPLAINPVDEGIICGHRTYPHAGEAVGRKALRQTEGRKAAVAAAAEPMALVPTHRELRHLCRQCEPGEQLHRKLQQTPTHRVWPQSVAKPLALVIVSEAYVCRGQLHQAGGPRAQSWRHSGSFAGAHIQRGHSSRGPRLGRLALEQAKHLFVRLLAPSKPVIDGLQPLPQCLVLRLPILTIEKVPRHSSNRATRALCTRQRSPHRLFQFAPCKPEPSSVSSQCLHCPPLTAGLQLHELGIRLIRRWRRLDRLQGHRSILLGGVCTL